MMFEFRLWRRVSFGYSESANRYPLSAVRVCCTKPANRAQVIPERVDLWHQ